MSRLTTPARDDVPEASKPILDAVNKQLGVVPNMFRLFATSPAALTRLTSLSGALSKALDVKTRERIALAVAQVNGCSYCLSAHTYLGLNLAKISPEEIALNRKGKTSRSTIMPAAHTSLHKRIRQWSRPARACLYVGRTARRPGKAPAAMRRSSASSRSPTSGVDMCRETGDTPDLPRARSARNSASGTGPVPA
jgi:AhpD family alkylhydroperoxidase